MIKGRNYFDKEIKRVETKVLRARKEFVETKFFTDKLGHEHEHCGRNTMSKMAHTVAKRKKNHARSDDYMGRALRKEPYQTLADARGGQGVIPPEKKYLYGKVIPQSVEAIKAEIQGVEDKEKKLGMIIGIIMRKKRAGTYECIHSLCHNWTSMRPTENNSFMVCQKCGFSTANSVGFEEETEE
jgi:hypothetical protein